MTLEGKFKKRLMNIVEKIKRQSHGERIAIQDGDLKISYDAIFDAVREVRGQLLAYPAFSDPCLPRIGVRFPNGLGYIVLALAVIDAGACFVPIPDELTDPERLKLIRETALHAVLSFDTPHEGSVTLPFDLGAARLEDCPEVDCSFPEDEFESINPAFIRFSSGTTAASKGVVLSHQSLLERITAANEGLEIASGDRVLWTLPMAHHFAVSIVLYLYFGATTVLETSHQPDEVYQAAKKSGTHLLYGSPFHFAQLAQCQIAKPLPELRMAVTTASSLSDGVAKAFKDRFNLPLTQALGIIEVGLPLLNKAHASDTPIALGQVLDSYEWMICSSGNERIGELLLRGPGMFDAYLIPWQTREQVTDDGWFATGDLVELLDSTDNTLVMRGRCKSVINVGGMKVFPEEIEAVLNEHPAIGRSRVFACHHATLGSYPTGEFVLSDNTDGVTAPSMREIREFCQNRLATYKIPMAMKQVEEIDLTASGKVKR